MVFAVGFALFALGILISVALHEYGHMWAAQATGMKVRRYFIGFGPTLWSFHRGETEYGIKAVPLGGFCDIVGMTALDEIAPEEVERAMYRQATWKRLVVMVGGIVMNFVLGFALIVVLAIGWGLPNLDEPAPVVGSLACVADANPDGSLQTCTGTGPAERGGLLPGDRVTEVDGAAVATWAEFTEKTREKTGQITYTVDRAGASVQVTVEPQQVLRYAADGSTMQVSAIGITLDAPPAVTEYGPVAAVPAAASFTGELFVRTFEALAEMPAKVAALWDAVTGGERDPETPVSIYGASRIGGESAEAGLWEVFVLMLASLNFFLGAFNILPLLPLDGGHIAVVLYEKVRNTVRGWRGLSPGGPVDFLKLLPLTYVAVMIGGSYMVLTLAADIINPIRLFP